MTASCCAGARAGTEARRAVWAVVRAHLRHRCQCHRGAAAGQCAVDGAALEALSWCIRPRSGCRQVSQCISVSAAIDHTSALPSPWVMDAFALAYVGVMHFWYTCPGAHRAAARQLVGGGGQRGVRVARPPALGCSRWRVDGCGQRQPQRHGAQRAPHQRAGPAPGRGAPPDQRRYPAARLRLLHQGVRCGSTSRPVLAWAWHRSDGTSLGCMQPTRSSWHSAFPPDSSVPPARMPLQLVGTCLCEARR